MGRPGMVRDIWAALRTHCIHTQRIDCGMNDLWMHAIDTNDIALLDCFLDNGFSVLGEGKHASPMLAYAAAHGNLAMIGYLKSRGASVHDTNWELDSVMHLTLTNLDKSITDRKLVTIVDALFDKEPTYTDMSHYRDFGMLARKMNYPLAGARIMLKYEPVQ